jgi:phage terminase large subunit-like protein
VPEHEFRRYSLAQFVRGGDQWLPAGLWRDRTDGERVVAAGEDVWLGFDGSDKHDATALVGCTADGHLFTVAVWERPERAPEDYVIPRHEVDAAVARAFRTWNVKELACDPWGWRTEIEGWAAEYGPTRVIEFPMRPSNTEPACGRFYAAVVEGDLTHDGDAALDRHVHNAVRHETRTGYYITKESPGSPRRIDLAMAAVMAFDRAKQRAAAGFFFVTG